MNIDEINKKTLPLMGKCVTMLDINFFKKEIEIDVGKNIEIKFKGCVAGYDTGIANKKIKKIIISKELGSAFLFEINSINCDKEKLFQVIILTESVYEKGAFELVCEDIELKLNF